MAIELLEPARAAALRTQRLTYPEVGATAGDLPRGYRVITRTAALPAGVDLDGAARELFRWQVQQRAGLRVAVSDERVVPDAVVVLSFGIGPLAVRAPCRVVYVVDEPQRRGFAYGTLPGHAESGEEAFVLERRADGSATFTITAFSRPATALAKLAGPLGRRVQDLATARYLRAFE
ncbi:MAG TPA: DUF1990 domain-containing protein [Actinophytocola sp.]|uniref:DUF1990 family protein n=1 Tax=Actinophytocola sp. TaxID=1872138 RepID=UPI002F932D08